MGPRTTGDVSDDWYGGTGESAIVLSNKDFHTAFTGFAANGGERRWCKMGQQG